MSDDVPPELIEAARRRRAEAQRELAELAKQKQDGLTRRSQLKALSMDQLRELAKAHGIDPDTVGQPVPPRSTCEVCEGSFTVESAPFGLVSLLCAEHADAVTSRVAELVLRDVIPEDFHEAKPSDLRDELRGWTIDVGGVYLYGDAGAGKSHDAATLTKMAFVQLRRKLDRIPRVVWRGVAEMMDDIAATFGTNQTYDMRAVRDADFLVLDDLGIADSMPFAVRKLYVLLEYRLQHQLLTIATSNKDLDELGEHLDSPQIASRLSQMCAQVSYVGFPDRRVDNAPKLKPWKRKRGGGAGGRTRSHGDSQ